jgi:hypothetical protein
LFNELRTSLREMGLSPPLKSTRLFDKRQELENFWVLWDRWKI